MPVWGQGVCCSSLPPPPSPSPLAPPSSLHTPAAIRAIAGALQVVPDAMLGIGRGGDGEGWDLPQGPHKHPQLALTLLGDTAPIQLLAAVLASMGLTP